MINKRYDIDSKFLNRLNSFNQDIKYVFNNYCIYNELIFPSSEDECKLQKGDHIAVSDFILLDDLKDKCFILNSGNIFNTIKTNKKNIKYLEILENKIYLSDDMNKYIIGIISDSLNKDKYNDTMSSFISNIELPLSDSERLVKNERLIVTDNVHRVKITREIIPGLKKTHQLSFMFKDIDDSDLFDMIIKCERDKSISYHRYMCINI